MSDKNNIEILAPAGSMECLKAAINAGCDAVYMGGKMFGARAYADNPNQDGMIEAIRNAHLYGKKIYMTINTLLKESELYDDLYNYLMPYYEEGLDAVIVQDYGVMKYIHDNFKGLSIHASTQMTLTSPSVVSMIKKYGIDRIVTPRELNFEEIRSIKDNTGLEVEVFVHGALCYCYSGQCVMSSMIGGRSGNRGRCAQPCRKEYKVKDRKGFFLSPKDLCTLDILPQIIEAGADSLKIEGRMKKPEYTALVVSTYRKYLDLYKSIGREEYSKYIASSKEYEDDINNLTDVYNRGGFTNGYFDKHNGKSLMSMDRPNHYGTIIGKVIEVTDNRCSIRLSKDVYAQDVLEIREKYSHMLDDVDITNNKENSKKINNNVYYNKRKNSEISKKLKSKEYYNKTKSKEIYNKIKNEGSSKTYEFTLKNGSYAGNVITAPFTKGLKISKGQEVYRIRNKELLTKINENYIVNNKKIKVNASFLAKVNETIKFRLCIADENYNKSTSIMVEGNIPDKAIKQSMTIKDVEKQLKKINNTEFMYENLDIILDNELFIPVKELNTIRREAFEKLKYQIYSQNNCKKVDCEAREYNHYNENYSVEHNICNTEDNNGEHILCNTKDNNAEHILYNTNDNKINSNKLEYNLEYNLANKLLNDEKIVAVSITRVDCLNIILEYNFVNRIYIDISNIAMDNLINGINKIKEYNLKHLYKKEIYVMLPHIYRPSKSEQILKEQIQLLTKQECISGFVVRNIDEMALVNNVNGYNFKIIGDYNLYVMNSNAINTYNELGVNEFNASLELNKNELSKIASDNVGVRVYGYNQLMVSAGCINVNTFNCKKSNKSNNYCKISEDIVMEDYYNSRYTVRCYCKHCYNIIYDCQPVNLISRLSEIKNMGFGVIRIDFTIEDNTVIRNVMQMMAGKKNIQKEYYGHYFKGVD